MRALISLHFWKFFLPYLLQDPKYPHRALSDALLGPDSVTLQRTMWSCRRVWLFEYEDYF
jgi:hypothetical protein